MSATPPTAAAAPPALPGRAARAAAGSRRRWSRGDWRGGRRLAPASRRPAAVRAPCPPGAFSKLARRVRYTSAVRLRSNAAREQLLSPTRWCVTVRELCTSSRAGSASGDARPSFDRPRARKGAAAFPGAECSATRRRGSQRCARRRAPASNAPPRSRARRRAGRPVRRAAESVRRSSRDAAGSSRGRPRARARRAATETFPA